MSKLSKVRRFVRRGAQALALSGAIVAGSLLGLHAMHAEAATTYNCDANSVIWCGAASSSDVVSKYNDGDGHNSAASIHNIYDWFGITSSDISGMGSDAVNGTVTKTGDVYVGSTLVATDALTAGRENISGSVKRTENGTTFYTRAPSVSFLDASLPAMVVMKDGQFQFAIMNSCCNPVTGTPKKPNYSVTKEVRAAGTSTYSSDVSVKSGSEVQYEIAVASTGAVPVDNVIVHDSLPSGITYTSGTLEENGKAVSATDASDFFGKGITLSSITNGDKDTFTFNAIAGPSATATTCVAQTLNNEAYISAPGLSDEQSGAKVTTSCTPPPPAVSLCCKQLEATAGTIDQTTGDQTYTLNASATVSNATITGYVFNFGDNSSKTVSTSATSTSTTHTYAPGTYTISVSVTATANGKTYTETSADCETTITVKPPVVPGTLTCKDLTLTAGTVDQTTGDTSYTLAATAAETNATITGYVFNFGDSSSNQTVTTGDTTASTTHTYAPGTYTASVVVNGTINGSNVTETSADCSGSITVKSPTPPPPTPTYVCDELTASASSAADSEGNVTYTLTATGSAENATITGYVFNFGDSSSNQTVTTGDTTASTTHTYAPGTYTAQVTVDVTTDTGTTEQATSAGCETTVTVAAPTCVSPTNGETYPAGSSECQAAPTCTASNGQTYPAGSSECATTPAQTCTSPTTGKTYPMGSSECQAPTCTSPTTGKTYPMGSSECQTPVTTSLPNTGPGDIFGLFGGTSIAGTALHWFRRRRNLIG